MMIYSAPPFGMLWHSGGRTHHRPSALSSLSTKMLSRNDYIVALGFYRIGFKRTISQ